MNDFMIILAFLAASSIFVSLSARITWMMSRKLASNESTS